ncbi:MAG TPA: insulinase family protein, partial [Novosphingobium sp.]|nr:insulinase family protein [Novosphingobium sp.]
LMRETASELSFPAAAVARERGVVLAEMRERDSWQYREMVNRFGFLDPDARYTHRLPIGTTEALNAATADSLAGFWRAHYVPANSVLVVVGDVDVAAVEAAIRSHFASWAAAPAAAQPAAGPVAPADAGRSAVYLDPALSERLVITRRAAWRPEPDTQAQRREDLLRRIGYAIVNRRLQHIARQPNLPFREAVFGSGDLFRAGRATSLVIDAVDGQWRRAMAVAAQTYRQVLDQGITRAELDEQIANIHTAAEHAAAGAATRGSGELLGAVFALLRDEAVPSDPVADAARIEGWLGAITPEAVLAALKADVVPLDNPLIRFQGRKAPDGNTEGLRTAWNEAMRSPLPARTAATASGFAYADF